ncbi:MAG: ArsR/SmtB family transcription factor [Candidatus Heimdallarchaeota archaeon]
MKALASQTRLEILDHIQRGITNAGEIALSMDRHRSSIDRHLRILADANVVKKIPAKTKQGKIVAIYTLEKNANVMIATLKHLAK